MVAVFVVFALHYDRPSCKKKSIANVKISARQQWVYGASS